MRDLVGWGIRAEHENVEKTLRVHQLRPHFVVIHAGLADSQGNVDGVGVGSQWGEGGERLTLVMEIDIVCRRGRRETATESPTGITFDSELKKGTSPTRSATSLDALMLVPTALKLRRTTTVIANQDCIAILDRAHILLTSGVCWILAHSHSSLETVTQLQPNCDPSCQFANCKLD